MERPNSSKQFLFIFLFLGYFGTSIYTLNTFCPLWYRIGVVVIFSILLLFGMSTSAMSAREEGRYIRYLKQCIGWDEEEHY